MGQYGHSIWDRDPVKCPHGHDRLTCQRVKIRVRDGRNPHYYCIIHENQSKVERNRRNRAWARSNKTSEDQMEIYGTPVLIGGRGSWAKGNRDEVMIMFTCGHDVCLNRKLSSFSPTYSTMSPFFCFKCDDWVHIHEYAATEKGVPSYLVYALEVPPLSVTVIPRSTPLVEHRNNMMDYSARRRVIELESTPVG